MVKDLETAARAANVHLYVALTAGTDPRKVDEAFAAMGRERVGAVVGLPIASYAQNRRRIAELALKHRLPTIFEGDDLADAGCLMTYGPSARDMWRLAASYVDRILKGARPDDLPVQQPTKFDLVINKKTAKALSVIIPPALLLQANRIIE